MRAFIAIELSEQVKDALSKIQAQLKKASADVKWVAPHNIHVTLKFLGEIDEERLDAITRILEEVAGKRSPFALRITSLGAFPKMNFPRVIWVGIGNGDNEIKAIAGELEEHMAKAGIPKEKRPFASHVTIGRVRSTLRRQGLLEELYAQGQSLENEGLGCEVTKITLFKSTLTPKGPLYEVLKEASLKTT